MASSSRKVGSTIFTIVEIFQLPRFVFVFLVSRSFEVKQSTMWLTADEALI